MNIGRYLKLLRPMADVTIQNYSANEYQLMTMCFVTMTTRETVKYYALAT